MPSRFRDMPSRFRDIPSRFRENGIAYFGDVSDQVRVEREKVPFHLGEMTSQQLRRLEDRFEEGDPGLDPLEGTVDSREGGILPEPLLFDHSSHRRSRLRGSERFHRCERTLHDPEERIQIRRRGKAGPVAMKEIVVVDIDHDSGKPAEGHRKEVPTLVPEGMPVREGIDLAMFHDPLPDRLGEAVVPGVAFDEIPEEIPEVGMRRRFCQMEMRQEIHTSLLAIPFRGNASPDCLAECPHSALAASPFPSLR